ncbi:hypothetical protein J3R83DRAFT_1558 [Lanmaoa asiatica]|nr:hypothetical protein J3R83DRAFT_1558 [Lanmaoa asiatica]
MSCQYHAHGRPNGVRYLWNYWSVMWTCIQYTPGKNFWGHDGYLSLLTGDLPLEFFTFGGEPSPLEDGLQRHQ